ncbi:MAG: hypothetical protein EOO11_22810 [Chitinophagaceae bacterium]|nr:MAG: hypothetical protein EOO11_22810 [Chitinophagaceae bacterium]
MEFSAPQDSGEHSLSLYLLCDAYLGCDQEFPVEISVAP